MSDPSQSNHEDIVEDNDSVYIIIDERLPAQTQSNHIQTKNKHKTETDDTFSVSIEEKIEVQTQTHTDNKSVANTEKDGNNKTNIREVTQQNTEAELSEVNNERDAISISIEDIVHFKDLDTEIIEDALAKNKDKFDLSKKKKGEVTCTCPKTYSEDSPEYYPQYLPDNHRNQRQRAKRKYRGYGYPPKLIFLETIQPAEPAGDPLEYEDGNRNDFVRKVFLICACMLAFTFTMTCIAYLTTSIRNVLRSVVGLILLGFAIVGTLTVQYTYCCSNCSRVFPCNYILNAVVTLCFSYTCSFIGTRYAPIIIISAAGNTFAITLLCLAIATSRFDFTKFILIVTVFCMSLLLASITCTILSTVFFVKFSLARLIILVCSSVAGSVMMAIEFQMILGGRSVQLGDEDYTFGAYMVYTSSVSLFIKIMGIINFFCSDDYE